MPIRMLTVARTKPHVHVRLNGPVEEQPAAGEKHAELEARAKIEDLKAQAEVDNLEAQAKNDVLVRQQHELVKEHESQDERRAEQWVATQWSLPHGRRDEHVNLEARADKARAEIDMLVQTTDVAPPTS